MISGVSVSASITVTPLPDAVTVKSWLGLLPLSTLPGSRAPVVVARLNGTTITSPAYNCRPSLMVNSAVSVASPSVMVVSEEVSATGVTSLSTTRIALDPAVDNTV